MGKRGIAPDDSHDRLGPDTWVVVMASEVDEMHVPGRILLASPDSRVYHTPGPNRWETTMCATSTCRNVFFWRICLVGKKNIHKEFGNPSS